MANNKEIGRIGQYRYYSPGSPSIFFEEFLPPFELSLDEIKKN